MAGRRKGYLLVHPLALHIRREQHSFESSRKTFSETIDTKRSFRDSIADVFFVIFWFSISNQKSSYGVAFVAFKETTLNILYATCPLGSHYSYVRSSSEDACSPITPIVNRMYCQRSPIFTSIHKVKIFDQIMSSHVSMCTERLPQTRVAQPICPALRLLEQQAAVHGLN